MGANWTIRFYRSARRELRSIQDEELKDQIIQAILALVEDPQPGDSVELEGHHHLYRIRIGGWRVVYSLSADEKTVHITRVRHRQNAYTGL
jgi:mRNA interferase RelE/StbE